jgi:hypothetical protein
MALDHFMGSFQSDHNEAYWHFANPDYTQYVLFIL